MEAKGCAKPMEWKDARRRFYWAVRAKVAWSSALAKLETASPESTPDYRKQLLETITSVDSTTDRRAAAETLEAFDLKPTIAQLKSDHLMQQMLALAQDDRKATMNGLVRLVENLSEEEKATLVNALQSSGRSSGRLFPLIF